jgi:cytochrome d ubiquinol oxidase subunit I
MTLDGLLIARAQFAFTIGFHILWPAYTIGVSGFIVILSLLWLKTGEPVYRGLLRFWIHLFALGFAMGVVTGVVMSYEIGTNWSGFAERTANVIGPFFAYEVLMAFFLEAGFIGVMLFGMNRVGPGLHFVACLMVALGAVISAFWILAANSWMQTPLGHAVNANGQFVPIDWLTIIFSPSFPYRLVHTVLAAYLTTALVVGGVGAWHLLAYAKTEGARTMFSMAMGMIAAVAPIQILAGDQHGLNTLEHQPAKVMGMEGHFQSHPDGAPLVLFGWPNMSEARVDYEVSVSKLSSLVLKHSLDAPLKGLDTLPRSEWPPVPIIFWSFRIMVGLGLLMLLLGAWSLWARWRHTLYDSPWLHRLALVMGPAGFVAVIAGWVTTEVGRQPYTVYGLLRTAKSVSPLHAPAVASSLLAFIAVYFIVFGAGIYYVLHLMAAAPHKAETGPEAEGPQRAAGITPGPAIAGGEG